MSILYLFGRVQAPASAPARLPAHRLPPARRGSSQVFPEVLGLDLDACVKPNVAFLGQLVRLDGEKLAATIVRKPNILGNKLDCAGECVGECNRCWVRPRSAASAGRAQSGDAPSPAAEGT